MNRTIMIRKIAVDSLFRAILVKYSNTLLNNFNLFVSSLFQHTLIRRTLLITYEVVKLKETKFIILVIVPTILAIAFGVGLAYSSLMLTRSAGGGYFGFMCWACPGWMAEMHGGYHGHYGEESTGEKGGYSEVSPDVVITLRTGFRDGRFFFVNEDGEINPRIVVKRGEVVKITVVNGDGITHNIAVSGIGVSSPYISKVGDEASIVFKAEKAGEYEYLCTVPGHAQSGMTGKIVVVESD